MEMLVSDFRRPNQTVFAHASSISGVIGSGRWSCGVRILSGGILETAGMRRRWVVFPRSREEISRRRRRLAGEVRAETGEKARELSMSTIYHRFEESEFPVWEKFGAVVRLSYGIGIYGAMALAGNFVCSVTGVDSMGGFDCSLEALLNGIGYGAPPIMALLFILDDEVVKVSPYAHAIRDVEDEELLLWNVSVADMALFILFLFILIVAASSVGEELFYRAAVQGGLAHMFLRSTELVKDAPGITSLTGMFPPFVPFAQAFAGVITTALTGSLYYIAASPKDPTYVVAPPLATHSHPEELKKLFAEWYERRQMKKIYSPILEGLVALYLGFEWIQLTIINLIQQSFKSFLLCIVCQKGIN